MTGAAWSTLRRALGLADRAVETAFKWIGCFALFGAVAWLLLPWAWAKIGATVFRGEAQETNKIIAVIPAPAGREAVVIVRESQHTYHAVLSDHLPTRGDVFPRPRGRQRLMTVFCSWRCVNQPIEADHEAIEAHWLADDVLAVCPSPTMELSFFDQSVQSSPFGTAKLLPTEILRSLSVSRRLPTFFGFVFNAVRALPGYFG